MQIDCKGRNQRLIAFEAMITEANGKAGSSPAFSWRAGWRILGSLAAPLMVAVLVAAGLLPGRDVENSARSIWQAHSHAIASLAAVLLFQSGLVAAWLYEHRRRRKAEVMASARLRELAQMNRRATAGALSTAIAHELNQPLGAVLANTETAALLLATPSPDIAQVKEILVDIKRDNHRISEVILSLRRLLQNARAETQDVDVNHAVEEAFKLASGQASARGVELSKSLSPEPLRVRGDPVQLQQVVLNLVVNALDALGAASTTTRRIIGRTARCDGARVEISIADTGPGIAADKLKRVFDPFFTTKAHGMGMGLSIVRTIVETHGGSIGAESRQGEGTVVRVRLPLSRQDQEVRG